MIYLSAHPDEDYFVWQSVVQLENFKSVGINLQDVYILVGTTTGKPLNPEWELIRSNITWIKKTKENSCFSFI